MEISTLLELLGFALITAATAVVGGLAPALFVGGGCLLFVGYALDLDRPRLPKFPMRHRLPPSPEGPLTNGSVAAAERERILAGKG